MLYGSVRSCCMISVCDSVWGVVAGNDSFVWYIDNYTMMMCVNSMVLAIVYCYDISIVHVIYLVCVNIVIITTLLFLKY